MQHHNGTLNTPDGLALYHQSWQPNTTPRAVLALIHGYGEHSGRYHNLVHYLVEHSYLVHSLDLRGHGHSPGQRGHIMAWDEYRTDLHRFLELLREQNPTLPLFLYGHSLGGLIVLDYLLSEPSVIPRGAIISSALLAQPNISPLLIQLSRILSRIRPTFSRDTKPDPASLSRDHAVVTAFKQDVLVHTMCSARLGTEILRTVDSVHARAHTLQVPLLQLYGTADQLVPPIGSRRFFERLQLENRTLLAYDGGYHEPHSDTNYPEVLHDVESWLTRHLP